MYKGIETQRTLSLCALAALCLWYFVPALLCASVTEPAKQITCTGKVTDAQGQPIAGAKVKFYEMTLADTRYLQDATLAAEATTKADGAFSFSAGAESHDYRYGYIVAEKQGLALDFANWDMRQNQELDIKLGQAKELAGVVVDENGKPISDATVSILLLRIGKREERVSVPRDLAPKLLTVITDTTGKFAFTNLPAEATAEFSVKKPARATVSTFRSRNLSRGVPAVLAGTSRYPAHSARRGQNRRNRCGKRHRQTSRGREVGCDAR